MGKWIVCCAWPYVNTVPHLGTFIHLLSADVFSRYLRLKGENVISVTGSDEHGTPIEVEAIKAGIEPKQLTNKYHSMICKLLKEYGVHFDNYTRTENPIHIKFVQEFFKKLYDNGYIFKKSIELPFCTQCNMFLPDRFIEGLCPYCGFQSARGDQCDRCGKVLDPLELIQRRCIFCGKTPIVKNSTHWFFNLPKLSDEIKAYLDSNPNLPENAKNFSYSWLREGLKPRAVTRDNKWGIPAPFPNSTGKTIYVWFEAVLGYVSASIELSKKIGNENLWKEFWFDKNTKNVHFIGKDNIPFHTIIFPALLIASKEGYVLPYQVSSTEFILYEGQKFSKSRKIGIWIDEALKVAPADYWRFMLLLIRPETKDANFTWKDFEKRINSDLNDAIGNFIHRTLMFVNNYFDGVVPEPGDFDEIDKKLIEEIKLSPEKVGELIEQFKLRDALESIVDLARKGNQYLSLKEPWHKIKTFIKEAATSLYLSIQLVHSLAILLEPFIPFTCEKIFEQLNLREKFPQRKWSDAGEFLLVPNHKIKKPEPLFQKISIEKIKKTLKDNKDGLND
ncbi:MAG: methionine--tRNA ligase [Candidatus Bathyarchaeia archaeon]